MGVEVQNISPGDGKASRLGGILRSKAHNSGLVFSLPIATIDLSQARRVKIHYVGTLTDGSKFDSSRDRNSPFETQIGVGRVIKGWDEGVPQLSLGQKAKLIITPDYGYGARGHPPVIPPNSTLIFEVELLAIN